LPAGSSPSMKWVIASHRGRATLVRTATRSSPPIPASHRAERSSNVHV
jgi:hypothetical protein